MPGLSEAFSGPGAMMLDEVTTKQAHDVLDEATDDPGLQLVLGTADGRRISMPTRLNELLLSVLESVAGGGAIVVKTLPAELTTSTAAEELGISRPTLMKLIRSNELQSFKVGTHTRISRDELRAYKARREEERVQAFEDFRSIDTAERG